MFHMQDSSSGKFTLISYVPEYSNVRLKMLYSSSRDDLKKTLGLSNFHNDFQVTDKVMEINSGSTITSSQLLINRMTSLGLHIWRASQISGELVL